MKQSGDLNPSEETGTECPINSKNGKTPVNKHGGVVRQQQHYNKTDEHSPTTRKFSLRPPYPPIYTLPTKFSQTSY